MQLRTLGKLELGFSSLSRPKPLLLLTYLSLEGSKGRTDLAELFYMGAKNPMSSLRVALKQIRESAEGSFVTDGRRLQVNISSDAAELLTASEAGQHEAVINYYQGKFLDGFKLKDISVELEDWIYETRDFLTTKVRQAYLALAQIKAQQNAFNEAAKLARHAFNLGTNDLEPSKLNEMYNLMLLADKPDTRDLKRLAADYGIHLSSSAAQAKAAYMLETSQQTTVSNVAERGNSFVGRTQELKVIGDTLAKPDCRLLSLIGQGGVGKTRLATQLALQYLAKQSFKDGIYMVHLDALSDAKQIPNAIAKTLALTLTQSDTSQQLIHFISSKNILIILDNFEHVMAAVSLCSELLTNCPNLKLVVSSRESLNIKEEHSLEISGLSIPSSTNLSVEEAQTYPSLKLFEDRVKRSNLNYQLNAEDLPHIVNIIRLVEGLPLGIELAAASTSIILISDIANELQTNLDTLYSNARDISSRHQSLRATFMYSWNLLSPKEQSTLKRLSVCKGGFTRQAASTIANADIPTLSSLVDKSLLKLSDTGRFDRHMLIYQYTQELFQVDPQKATVEAKHAAYYTNLALEAEPQLIGKKQLEWLNVLELEHDNMRAALNWNLRTEPEQALRQAAALRRFWEIRAYASEGLSYLDKAVELAKEKKTLAYLHAVYALAALLRSQHNVDRAKVYLEACAALAQELEAKQVLADTYNQQAGLAWVAGDVTAAQAFLALSLELKRDLKDKRGIAISLDNLGILAKSQKNYSLAKTLYLESLQIHRVLGDKKQILQSLRGLGLVSIYTQDLQDAQAYFEEALELAKLLSDIPYSGQILNDLGRIRYSQNKYLEAEDFFLRSLSIAEKNKAYRDTARALLGLGLISYLNFDLNQAKHAFSRALQLAFKAKDNWEISCAFEALACIESLLGDIEKAALLWGAALKKWQDRCLFIEFYELELYQKTEQLLLSKLGQTDFSRLKLQGQEMATEVLIDLVAGVDLKEQLPINN